MLCLLPHDVLQSIAVEVANTQSLGLLDNLVALLQTCQHIYVLLSPTHNNHLYGRIFRLKFDTGAAARHLGDRALYSPALASQLREYCAALKRIRSRDLAAPPDVLERTLWAAFFLLAENDGRNHAQLQLAGLGAFVDAFVRTRLWDGHESNHGWPLDTTANALALYLMWYMTDSETLHAESPEDRRQLMEITRPYVIAPFKYASFHAPDIHFRLPLPANALAHPTALLQTPHGPYPPYPRSNVRVEHVHYGMHIKIRPPLAATYASLLYFARSEAIAYRIPQNIPANREAAHAVGIHGVYATQEDYKHFNAHKAASVVPKGSWHRLAGESPASLAWDNDLNRMRFCADPFVPRVPGRSVFTYGSLSGSWFGRMLMSGPTAYLDTVKTPQYMPGVPAMVTLPISFRLREHHCVGLHTPVPHGAPAADGRAHDDGVVNAWFPPGTSFREQHDVLTVQARDGRVYKYATYHEGRPTAHSAETCATCRARAAERNSTRVATLQDFPPPGYAHDVPSEEDAVRTALGAQDLDTVLRVAEDEARALYGGSADHNAEEDAEADADGVRDVVLTGESVPAHGEAWHPFWFYGRVRRWDGLVALVRVPRQHLDLGVAVFRGYVVGGRTLVGAWRSWNAAAPRLRVPLEGPFVAGRTRE
ncbi:hypothetical protein PsYK624_140710 [Phanerochaete sordida]|uniref:F-box domain-containing protein n=1 Tax=Phanerochaete sordida TaxID=48140 RepID=A0A9P3GQZ8_9APHY|nr:hypothetical protein PsYK624_140710 [Phanerochaete sordida]